ncbi:MAG: site-specific DNA-methyltransferase [Phycisphaerales bacterium]|nr:site-specific DNA-methyltransferase [Phycisphaerales bacterium]
MQRKQKLELTWIGKENRPRLEPRILLEDPSKSYHAAHRVAENDQFDNRLIQGDNLLALKALEAEFAGKIKCVYIDPPFNTGQAFEHYDDGLEHSTWLAMMAARIELIHRLLSPEGVLFVHLDQEENHYLKVMLDELFCRYNFLGQVAYERSGVSGIGQGGSFLVNTHEYILCYARDRAKFQVADNRGATPLEAKDMKRYSRVFVSPGSRTEVARFIAPSTGEPVVIYQHHGEKIDTISLRRFEERQDEILAEYITHFPKIFRNTSIQAENEFQTRILSHCGDGLFSADYLVSRGKREGQQITAYYLNGQVFAWLADTAEVRDGQVVKTNKLSDFWSHAELPKADLANEGGVDFRRGKKPEVLLKRLLDLVTSPGDWVLDSFAGSGTTGAVAHKMGRRWIMVEIGEHCDSHIVPRLKKIIDGQDASGVTETTGWRGGGGFRYSRLAPSLLEKDKFGNWVISKEFNANMLAEAVCKLEGFAYAPSDWTYWQHGHSTERDFIYVTTQTLTRDQLQQLSEEVGDGRTLLVVCKAFTGKGTFPNLTVKKIPKAVMSKCEWGKDDYSLAIHAMPSPPPAADSIEPMPVLRGARKAKAAEPDLFGSQSAETKGGRK